MTVKIRVIGLPEEVAATVVALNRVPTLRLRSASAPYSCRNGTEVRQYVEADLAESGGGQS